MKYAVLMGNDIYTKFHTDRFRHSKVVGGDIQVAMFRKPTIIFSQ
jgi:hypothetical protein